MKVLTLTTLFPNSEQPLHGVFIRERIKHLSDLCEVRVVAPIILPPPKEGGIKNKTKSSAWKSMLNIPREEKQDDLLIYHPRIYHVPKVGVYISGLYYFLFLLRTIKKIKRDYDFDVIDSHWAYPDGFAAVLLGRALDVPVTISCRGTDVNLYTDLPILKNLVSFALSRCTAVIAVSQSLKDRAVSTGISADKIMVIANGVDINKFRYLPRDQVRRNFNLPLDRRIILSIGHLVERKGFHHIIDAMDILVNRKGYKDLLLLIVGEGPYRSRLEKQIQEYSLEGNVMLAGAKSFEEISEWHNTADLFCLASSREGWPNVLFETLASGNPVVATNAWGNAEVISSDEYGILVERRTGTDLAEGIDKAFNRRWDRKKIIEYAQNNTWDKVGQKVFGYLSTVIKHKGDNCI